MQDKVSLSSDLLSPHFHPTFSPNITHLSKAAVDSALDPVATSLQFLRKNQSLNIIPFSEP